MISVVVPAYNRRETLAATLDSLLAQTYGDWRAIVVDDGSVDGTAELVEQYAARDGRFSVHRQSNGGVSNARNTGIALVETPWLFFLDADDWIVPTAFELLVAAAVADPAVDAVYGGYVRIDAAGRELQRQLPALEQDLFPLFARTCAIAVHSCLVKTEVVRRAGGFDESLVTCEDWDVWQRVARVGARFASIPDYIAYYRLRVGSASGSGWRMLEDGLLVIDRGHGEDPRLTAPEPVRAPFAPLARDVARTYFACYAAGLEIAAGGDAVDMVELLGDGITGDLDPHGVAETFFYAVPVGLATATSEWARLPEDVHRRCREFVEALGARTGNHWLAFGALEALERLLLAAASDERPRRAGRWYVMDLDLDGPPPQDLELPEGVERLLVTVRFGERRLDDVELPVVDGWVPARVLADAIVAPLAWDVLQAFFERHVYPQLEIELRDGSARVARGELVLFEGELDPTRGERQGVHDRVGWIVLLQELWERHDWLGDDFYDGARRAGGEPVRRPAAGERVAVELAEPLPALRPRGGGPVEIAVTAGGAPLAVIACAASRGGVSAHRLRREILIQTAYGLCGAVVREAIVLAPAAATGSLRERLAAAAGASEPIADAIAIGRAETVGAGRWSVLPAAAAPERLALAQRDGDPVLGTLGDGAAHVLSAPTARDGAARRPWSEGTLRRALTFDRTFGERPDPWHYDAPYEQRKYEQTLELLPARAERALELGCAEGAFTRLLAARVSALTAADISPLALTRAARGCAGAANVTFVQLDAFEQPLGGPFDLIVCSELLYYAEDRAMLARAARALAAALAPGGTLVAAHAHAVVDDPDAPGFDWDVPFGAAAIERALLGTRLLDLRRELRTTPYRVQRYARRRTPRLPAAPARLRTRRTAAAAGAMDPEHVERFLPDGGRVLREPAAAAPATSELPVLMYHRVAPDGAEATRRWRVHPDDFDAQLRHLREAGYQSLTLAQWRAACERRQPLPARAVLLTFDDGYADFPDYALPLLSRHGFLATMFVVTDLVGASNAWDAELGESLPLMDWEALAAIRADGVEIGSHSSEHRPLVTLSAAELTRDLCRSRERLRERLGTGARSVCYPYGLHDAGVLSVAGACGFDSGVTTNEWHASFGDDPLGLPRLEVHGTETLAQFAAKLRP
jgi:peptidoglycan/xylan/chitin deacetylase (PgdA/CDA1 family)